ncbi:MAG: metallophosphoesterase [Bacteroidales bacterium]
MKRGLFITTILTVAAVVLVFTWQSCTNKDTGSFSFAFMTDIHLTYERHAVEGFKQAIGKVNELKPDFVITGGDLIMDALQQRYSAADSLYDLYIETIKDLKVPLYNTMGNHELYGIYSKSGADKAGNEYGEKMYEARIGNSYYSFEHKGWKFMVLNSVEDTGKDRYIGKIDDQQLAWIKEELDKTSPSMPIVISTHIPFITANTQKYSGTTVANDSSTVVYNGKEVLDLFKGHNLKLVLQGHLHTVEDVFVDGIHFVTGGAVSAGWWNGPFENTEEGFMMLTVKGEIVSWKYIDYGWKVNNEKQ